MVIRRANPNDINELIRLIKEFTIDAPKRTLPKEQQRIRAFKNVEKMLKETAEKYTSNPEFIVFVADEKGFLKGFIVGEIKERKYKIYNKEGYLIHWFVEEGYQGKGIGKALFNKLVEKFKEAGCTHIGLDTHLTNKKAIEIYERLGFTKRLITFFKPLKNLS